MARAAGETAPLLFTALFFDYWPHAPFLEPTSSFAVLIYNFFGVPYPNQMGVTRRPLLWSSLPDKELWQKGVEHEVPVRQNIGCDTPRKLPPGDLLMILTPRSRPPSRPRSDSSTCWASCGRPAKTASGATSGNET